MAKPRRSRSGPSGPSLSDERRAELGYGRLTLRLRVADLEAVAALAERRGVTRAEAVAVAVREALERV